MFYRLSHIDDAPLPHELRIDGVSYLAVRGGLLLEPPNREGDPSREGEGLSTIRFFGSAAPNEKSEFLGSSREPYRWLAPGRIDISRKGPDRGARFTGSVDGAGLELRAEGGARFLASGTRLIF